MTLPQIIGLAADAVTLCCMGFIIHLLRQARLDRRWEAERRPGGFKL